MYALNASIQAAYKESQSLKGLAKMRYNKEHKESLSKYPELKERMTGNRVEQSEGRKKFKENSIQI